MTNPTMQPPNDMTRTDSFLVHPVDGWEAVNTNKPELGVLRIAKVPGSTLIGLFIRLEAIMFPVAYFKNWHAAHRFVAWMEASEEPKPTMEEEFKTMMERMTKEVDSGPTLQATIANGEMTFAPSDHPIGGKFPRLPADKDGETAELPPASEPTPVAANKPKKKTKPERGNMPMRFPKSPAR